MNSITPFGQVESPNCNEFLVATNEPIQNILRDVTDEGVKRLQSKEDLIDLFRKHYLLTENSSEDIENWVNSTYKRYPRSDKKVLRFIANISFCQGKANSEVIYMLFASGYCYYFALMLKDAFGGTVCWHYGYGHIVWTNDSQITDSSIFYDIGGVFEDYDPGEVVPVEELGDGLEDFRHRR